MSHSLVYGEEEQHCPRAKRLAAEYENQAVGALVELLLLFDVRGSGAAGPRGIGEFGELK